MDLREVYFYINIVPTWAWMHLYYPESKINCQEKVETMYWGDPLSEVVQTGYSCPENRVQENSLAEIMQLCWVIGELPQRQYGAVFQYITLGLSAN